MRRARLVLPVLPLFFYLACDPQGPGAMGQLTVAAEANVEAGRTLEIRAFPDDSQPFDPATANLSDRDWLLEHSQDLAEVEFPFAYWIGSGLGYADHERWRLVAWIAESENLERPRSGEWYGTRLFSVAKCGFPFGGYCGVVRDIDIEINARMD